MSGWSGVLAMTLVVRDEEDILEANLDYHLSQGVDLVYVVDHLSEDATPEILADYARSGQVHVVREESEGFEQARLVKTLLARVVDRGADWVIHGDADEFWIPFAGTLRDVFAAVPDRYGYLRVPRSDMPPVPDDGRPFYERMVVRERNSLNLRGGILEPKVVHRPAAGLELPAGNHELVDPALDEAPDIGAVEIFHFPMRSFERFEAKVVKSGAAHEAMADRPEGVGVDQLKLLEVQRQGRLRDYYDDRTVQLDSLNEKMVFDPRLRDRMRERSRRVEDSPWVSDVLRRTWLRGVEAADQRQYQHEVAVAALNDEVRRRELALGDARWEHAKAAADLDVALARERELIETVETIRSSRIMRYTEPARRAYYRMRPGGRLN